MTQLPSLIMFAFQSFLQHLGGASQGMTIFHLAYLRKKEGVGPTSFVFWDQYPGCQVKMRLSGAWLPHSQERVHLVTCVLLPLALPASHRPPRESPSCHPPASSSTSSFYLMSLSSLGDLGCLALDAFSAYVIRSALQVRCEGVCVDLHGWSRVHQLSNLSLPGRSLSQLKPLFPRCGGLNRKCPPTGSSLRPWLVVQLGEV